MDILLDSFFMHKGCWADMLSVLNENISLVAESPEDIMLHKAHVVLPMVHSCS